MNILTICALPAVLGLNMCQSISGAYMTDKGLILPNMPANVEVAGKVVNIPKGPISSQQFHALLAKVRQNEIVNANAVRDAKRYYKKLQEQYRKGA